MLRFLPGCCVSLVSSVTTSPLIRVEFCHSTVSRVVEATSLEVAFM